MLRIPIIGKIVLSLLSPVLHAHYPLLCPRRAIIDALSSVAGATGNIVYEEAAYRVRDDVSTGTQLKCFYASHTIVPLDFIADDSNW